MVRACSEGSTARDRPMRRAGGGDAPADPLPLPTLPPEPPPGMRPLRPGKLVRCEWVAASPAPRRERRPWVEG